MSPVQTHTSHVIDQDVGLSSELLGSMHGLSVRVSRNWREKAHLRDHVLLVYSKLSVSLDCTSYVVEEYGDEQTGQHMPPKSIH
jgi:hypothetical protein